MAIDRQVLLSTGKHANQHRLSRLIVEANSAELRAVAEAVKQYTDQLIAELEARTLTAAAKDVLAERQRQQSVEGWTPEHDDQYGKSQLLWASSCYLLNTIQPFNRIPMDWPWDSSWWNPTSPRRDLVKASALIIAEMERRDRAAGIDTRGSDALPTNTR